MFSPKFDVSTHSGNVNWLSSAAGLLSNVDVPSISSPGSTYSSHRRTPIIIIINYYILLYLTYSYKFAFNLMSNVCFHTSLLPLLHIFDRNIQRSNETLDNVCPLLQRLHNRPRLRH